MVKKSILVLTVVAVSTTFFSINNGQPCNPANWCNPKSMLCKSAEAIEAILTGKELPANEDSSRGVCTDAYRWLCNKSGFNCKRYEYSAADAWMRCSEITNPSRKGNIYPGKFIEACRDGEYTCKNGYCAFSIEQCNNRGGVKYSNKRCEKDSCGATNVLKDICDMGSTPVESTYECVEDDLAQIPACCPAPASPECRFLELAGGTEVGFGQCGGECPDTCSPTSSPTTPTTAPTRNNGQTSPPTDSPTNPPIVEYPPAGVVVKFIQKTDDRDCCCKISCDCFGDPHCTSFFGQQQTSKVSDGSFDMFRNLDIGIKTFLGPPQGIIEHVEISTSEDPRIFKLSTKFCNNATHNWQDASTGNFVNDIPSNWDASYSIDPEGAAGFTDPSLYKVRDKKGQILIEIKCQPFLWVVNEDMNRPKYQKSTRIDVVVTAWRDKVIKEGSNEVCCPSQAENEEWVVQTGASGYCVDPAAQPIPGAQANSRRLSSQDAIGFTHEKELQIMQKELGHEIDEEIKFSRVLKTATELCEEYLDKAGQNAVASLNTLDKCLQNIADFGLGSLATLIELIDSSTKACISDPLDSRLPGPNGLKECEDGIILEIQRNGKGDWVAFQAFPAGLPYCDDSVIFDFSKIQIEPGVFLTANDRYRLKQCTPDTERCGVCAPLTGLQDAGFSFIHQCETYSAYKNFLKFDLLEGLQNGEFACGYKYFGSTDPLACLKDYLPSLFNN